MSSNIKIIKDIISQNSASKIFKTTQNLSLNLKNLKNLKLL